MDHKSQPRSIAWFQDEYKNGRLILRPPFQRKPVWTEKQRSALIESILLKIPIPEIYVQAVTEEDGTTQFGVVDGQQRLRTILQFIGIEHDQDQDDHDNNGFVLEELPQTSPHFRRSFADLTSDEKKRLFQYEVCVRFLYTENSKIIENVFKRLNKFMVPLKAQELRNATYHGAFAKLSEELADAEYWAVNRIVTPAAIRRMADVEMMSDLLIGLIHGPQGGSPKIIDSYYDKYEQFEDDFPDQTRIKRTFDAVRAMIERLFPNIADTRWGNRADFYTLFVALGATQDEISKKREKHLRDKLLSFAQSVAEVLHNSRARVPSIAKDYARAIEKGSNDKARRSDRHEALVKVIESARA